MGIRQGFNNYFRWTPLKIKKSNVYIYVLLLLSLMLLLDAVYRMTIIDYPSQLRKDNQQNVDVLLQGQEAKEVSMLLNSGLVQAQKAELKVILWFEQEKPSLKTLNLPQEGWVWEEKDSSTPPYTISGSTIVDKKSEPEIFAWYLELAQKVQRIGGRAYWDERVSEGMDLIRHAKMINIQPYQSSFSRNTISITGRQELIPTSILAGEDLVNIQLLSRSDGKEGKTAIAIPVLLLEF